MYIYVLRIHICVCVCVCVRVCVFDYLLTDSNMGATHHNMKYCSESDLTYEGRYYGAIEIGLVLIWSQWHPAKRTAMRGRPCFIATIRAPVLARSVPATQPISPDMHSFDPRRTSIGSIPVEDLTPQLIQVRTRRSVLRYKVDEYAV